MRSLYLLLTAAVLTLGVAQTASADGLRCGSRLVRDGDPRALVRARCGEPADVQTYYIQRQAGVVNGRRGARFYGSGGYIEIPVETWTYNFGPYRLMYQIRFVDGLISEIQSLGYGYREEYNSDRRTSGNY